MDSQIRQQTTNEREFLLRALESGLRIDGRSAVDYRHMSIRFGRSDSSSEVELGTTRVLACVSANLVAPHQGRPQEGKVVIETYFSEMAEPGFEKEKCEEYALQVNGVILKGIRESRALDLESLCVIPGLKVWEIRVDINLLENGGNLTDAAFIATVAALTAFSRPDCTVGEDGKHVTKHDPEVREPVPLTFHHQPMSTTFAYTADGNMFLDPTHEEEAVMQGRLTITTSRDGEVCGILKPGGAGLASANVMKYARVAVEKASELTVKINNAVEAHKREKALGIVKLA